MSGSSKKKSAAGHSSQPNSPAGERLAAGLNDRWPVIGVCLFLAAIIWVVFGQTLHHEFVNYDDNLYVYENSAVTHGLNLKGVEWAFTHVVSSNWHPVTMLSHMLDCQLYALNAGGHHLTNILIHTATVILLFLVLRRMTGCLWRSAFVAAVFAIHPLRVESVAWVAERKDVLSGLFFILTLWAYARFVADDRWQATRAGAQLDTAVVFSPSPPPKEERGGVRRPIIQAQIPSPQPSPRSGGARESAAVPSCASRSDFTPSPVTRHSSPFYSLVLLFFTLGLMSKPMLVTLPLVLLLLDYWPLGRMSELGVRSSELENAPCPSTLNPQPSTTKQPSTLNHQTTLNPQPPTLLLEKLPLFGLAVASCVVTIFVQHEAILSVDKFPLSLRVGNALISYVVYLGQMFWPGDLAVLYPLGAGGVAASKVVLSLVLLAGITAGVIIQRRRRPYLLAGWLWYLIMLAPVIGIVQVGSQAHADRYTYLPQVGLYLMLTWLAAELCAGWRQRRLVLGGGAAIILVAMIICARAQTAYWRNSESLWTHTLDCTSGNFIGHYNFGFTLYQKGRADEAIAHYQKALEIKPDYVDADVNLGMALLKKGRVDEAIAYYQDALRIKPDSADACYNLGMALLQKGQLAEAMVYFQKVLQIKPDDADASYNLANALVQNGRGDEAIAHFQKALQMKPDYTEAHINLGMVLFQKGQVDEAMAHFQKALQIKPDSAEACYNLGMALLQNGRVDDAIAQYQAALRISPDNAKIQNNLGSALLQKGKVDEAIVHFQRALQINPAYAGACYNLGNALLQKGQVNEAIARYQRALQIKPDFAEVHANLDNALLQKGRVDEAIVQYQQALQLNPDSVEVLNNLAWLLATCLDAHVRDGAQAVQYAEHACELTHYGVAIIVGTLAAAYAEAGRFDDAVAAAQKACGLAEKTGDANLLERNRKLLELYRTRQPYHEPAEKVVSAPF